LFACAAVAQVVDAVREVPGLVFGGRNVRSFSSRSCSRTMKRERLSKLRYQ
jgi:hypothetical protein